MNRSIVAIPLLLASSLACIAALSGCAADSHAYVDAGDAKSVSVVYGHDLARALPLAREHCAQYERVPQLRNVGEDMAVFDCVPR
jgi:hypothetical protein